MVSFTSVTRSSLCAVLLIATSWSERGECQTEAPEGNDPVSVGPEALPGLVAVGIVATRAPRFSIATSAGYGWVEKQPSGVGDHRLTGSLALGGALFPWLEGAVRTDYRDSRHFGAPDGKDESVVIDITPVLRGGYAWKNGLHLGAEARAPLFGATRTDDAGPEISWEGRLLSSYHSRSGWIIAAQAGYRLGVSSRVRDDAASLTPGDRLALGLSEFDAVPVGLGLLKNISRFDLFAELSWDLLLGAGAPPLSESPFTIGAGGRTALSDHFSLQAFVQSAPLSRPPATSADPLVPLPPRIAGLFTLSYTWGPKKDAPLEAPVVLSERPQDEPPEETTEVIQAPEETTLPPVETGGIRLVIVDHTGHPISDATVTLEFKDREGQVQSRTVPLLERNEYELLEVPTGDVKITITANLLKEQHQLVTVTSGDVQDLDVELDRAETVSSQLRGIVRSYAGEGIAAKVTVFPGNLSTSSDKKGEFVLDLAPGTYRVSIEAEGYRTQNRSLDVRPGAVTILNADLQRTALGQEP